MTTLRDAVKRLQIIYNECNPQSKERRQQEQNMDEFTKLKKLLHQDVKQVRIMLKEREELLNTKPGSKDAAEASHRIRARIKQIKEDAMKFQTVQKQEEKKILKKGENTKGKDQTGQSPQEIVKQREETVQLVLKHIEEIETMEKKRYTDKTSADRAALFDGAASAKLDFVAFDSKPAGKAAFQTNLPDIDDDPEVGAGLQLLQENNRAIDQDLDTIRQNVGVLKEIAINMDQEIQKQNAMLDVIDTKVDKAQVHLDKVNMKMKQALDGVMKGDKFLVNCILLCVLLSLAGFIASYYL
ncbi:hypothetical protein MIR68_007800 [Amoeboaphelidium protococcarum]|nr:hypothetical protein MIR68_007800 [Amoeboaphelidium protococcarum]KAI3642784.1 hypothetical protein MP228_012339 [Amoeboaphelidium protococcarum]KAI3645371.1 hypothetical protein MP228_008299 [Amoeboaphelidium protococcarum]